MRGRKPVPTMMRKLHGNPGKRPLPKDEPIPANDLRNPPEWLSSEQKANWSYAIDNAPPGLLKRLDASVLTTWVVASDLHRQATLAQGTVGLLVKVRTRASAATSSDGVPTASPYLNIITQQAKILLKAASELGFTPVSRPRISSSPLPLAPLPGSDAESDRPTPSLEEFLAAAPKRTTLN